MNAIAAQKSAPAGKSEAAKAASRTPAAKIWGELAFAGFLFLLVGSVFWQALKLPFVEPGGAIASGFFPISLTVIVMALIAVYGLVLVGRLVASSGVKAKASTEDPVVSRDQLVLLGLIVVAVLVGDEIGLFAVSGLLLFSGLLLIERAGLRRSLVFTLGTLVSIYLIFHLWLGMNIGLRLLF